MRIKFTKMQGAGNDFVVLDETRSPLGLTEAHYRFLGNRHFGVGADQILTVRPASTPDMDFEYIIHNADGAEVEQCGNGARCFARFVREQKLSDKDILRVQTKKGVIEPRFAPDGRITVNMGCPVFAPEHIPFNPQGLPFTPMGLWGNWVLELTGSAGGALVSIATVSMGNPHAVVLVEDVDHAPVRTLSPHIQQSGHFPEGVNVGFLQIKNRNHVKLRVFERGVGETLACGTGSCAAVVAGIRLGLLDPSVEVETRGGLLGIAWGGHETDPVLMTGPAVTVFHGEIELPEILTA